MTGSSSSSSTAPAGTAPGLEVPEGIRLVYLPPYTPELQPAESFRVHVDERRQEHFETLEDLDAVVAEVQRPRKSRDLIRGQAAFHRWPNRTSPI